MELEDAVDGGNVLVTDRGIECPVNRVVELQVTAEPGADSENEESLVGI